MNAIGGISAALSGSISSGLETGNKISVAVAKTAMDSARSEGEAALSLLDAAVAISRGAISATPGAGETGRSLDLVA